MARVMIDLTMLLDGFIAGPGDGDEHPLANRGVYETFQHVSRQHLQRYLTEFDFRYNSRETSDGGRAKLAIRRVNGKGLMYRDSSANITKWARECCTTLTS